MRAVWFVLGPFLLSWSLVATSNSMALAAESREPTEPAEPISIGRTDDRWEFGVVPYMWFISVTGDATVRGKTASVDASFGDVWDNLNFGLMGLLQVRKGRIGGYADILYARLESENGVGRRGTANSKAYQTFFENEECRTCKKCGHVVPAP